MCFHHNFFLNQNNSKKVLGTVEMLKRMSWVIPSSQPRIILHNPLPVLLDRLTPHLCGEILEPGFPFSCIGQARGIVSSSYEGLSLRHCSFPGVLSPAP